MTEISLHILDIVQNSIRAQASLIRIEIDDDAKNDLLTIVISDNGKGMDIETLAQVADPFFTTRTTRKVGLGLSLLKQNAEQTGGSFSIESEVGKGCHTKAVFVLSHLDRQPMGDMAGTMTLLIGANPDIRFIYTHKTALSALEFDTLEAKDELDGVPISHPDILKAIRNLIEDTLDMIEATK
jgi:nitrogen-specific signal transduction histidine kinase